MPSSRRPAVLWGTAAVASLTTACSLFVSLDDLQTDDGGAASGSPDGGSNDATAASDAPSTCGAKLDSDPMNCGSCGHVCGTENVNGSPTCAAGKCVFVCNVGFGNCDGDGAHGCETALASDNPRACGSCGRDCLEGTCSSFQCTTLNVFSVPAGQNLHDVAVDGTHVYWTQDYANENPTDAGACTAPEGGIFQSAPDGGGRALLAANEHPLDIGLDDAGVYWKSTDRCSGAVAGSFKRIGKDGKCSAGACPSTLGSVTVLTDDLAVGAGNVYFLDSSLDVLYSLRTAGTGSSPLNIASGFHSYHEQVAADSVGVVWTTENEGDGKPAILGLSIDPSSGMATEGMKTLVVPTSKPFGIASDGTTVFFGAADSIYSVPRGGGAAKKLASGQAPYALAVDDAAVYWTNPTLMNSVMRIGKDGTCRTTTCPEVLATGGEPSEIAVDAVAVYWLDGKSRILKVGK